MNDSMATTSMYNTWKQKKKFFDYSCDICGKLFNHSDSVRVHQRLHTGERPYECEYCKRTFTYRTSYKCHVLAAHDMEEKNKTDVSKHSCDVCGKVFTHQGLLRIHKRVHTKNKPFKCDKCLYTFTYKTSLRTHMAQIHGIKEMNGAVVSGPSCNVCGQIFKHALTLKVHKRIHSGERPLKSDRNQYSTLSAQHSVRNQTTPSDEAANVKRKSSSCRIKKQNAMMVPANEITEQDVNRLSALELRNKNLSGISANATKKPSVTVDAARGQGNLKTALKTVHRGTKLNGIMNSFNKNESGFSSGQKSPSTYSDLARGNRDEGQCDKPTTIFSQPEKPTHGNKQQNKTSSADRRQDTNGYFMCSLCKREYMTISALKSHERIHKYRQQSKINKDNSADFTDRTFNKMNLNPSAVQDATFGKIKHSNNATQSAVPTSVDDIASRGTPYAAIKEICKSNLLSAKLDRNINDGEKTKTNHVTLENYQIRSEDASTFQKIKFKGKNRLQSSVSSLKSTIGKMLYYCDRCKGRFKSRQTLSGHVCESKRCPTCYESFKTLIQLRQHVAAFHPSMIQYTCTECKLTFKTLAEYTLHVKSHEVETRDARYECSVCKHNFHSLTSLMRHKRLHKRLYKCKVCQKVFCSKAEQMKHSRNKHMTVRSFQCPYCNLFFSTIYSRIRHIKTVHNKTINRPLRQIPECLPIKADTSRKTEALCACTRCNKVFSKERLLLQHVQKMHRSKNNKPRNKVKATAEMSIKNYDRVAPSTKIKTCKDSEQINATKTSNKSGLVMHGTITEGKKLTCDTCGESFIGRSNLLTHVNEQHLEYERRAEDELTEDGFDGHEVKNVQGQHTFTHTNLPVHSGTNAHAHKGSKTETESLLTSLPKDTKKELNNEILRQYYVFISNVKPSTVNPVTDCKLYECEVCLTTFSRKDSLQKHIKNRAYDHGFYLRKKLGIKHTESKSALVKDQNESCDSDNEVLPHRAKYEQKKFRSVGVKGSDKTSIDTKSSVCNIEIPTNGKPVCNTVYEVTSSTHLEPTEEEANEKEFDEVSIYIDRAEDESFDVAKEIGPEPLYTARPYYAEINKDMEFEQNKHLSYVHENEHSPDYKGNKHDKTFERFYEQTTEQNIVTLSKEITEQTEMQNGIHLDENDVSTDLTERRGPSDRKELDAKQTSQHVNIFNSHEKVAMRGKSEKQSKPICSTNCSTSPTDLTDKAVKTGDLSNFRSFDMDDKIIIVKTGENGSINSVDISNKIESMEGNGSKIKIYPNTDMIKLKGQSVNVLPNDSPAISNASSGETVTSSLSSILTIGDDKTCTRCRQLISNKQINMRCKLCDQIFCLDCSTVPKDVYDKLNCNGKGCPASIWWTCNVCRHLVPKFMKLLHQLGDFEHVINSRITDMKQKLTSLGRN